MNIKTKLRILSVSLLPFILTSCPSPPAPDPEERPDTSSTPVSNTDPAAVPTSSVKSAESILKDLGMESKAIPTSLDRIVGLEKSLNSPISLQLVDGKIAENSHNKKQINEIKRACRVKEPGSFLLVVKSEDSALLSSISETFSKDPKIECVDAGTTATADQVDLILKLY